MFSNRITRVVVLNVISGEVYIYMAQLDMKGLIGNNEGRQNSMRLTTTQQT